MSAKIEGARGSTESILAGASFRKRTMEWEPVSDARVYEVTLFDDGRAKYASHVNRWRIVARWKGKVRLRNEHGVVIDSISEWKVQCLPCVLEGPAPFLGDS